jgi:hypothetical protein
MGTVLLNMVSTFLFVRAETCMKSTTVLVILMELNRPQSNVALVEHEVNGII